MAQDGMHSKQKQNWGEYVYRKQGTLAQDCMQSRQKQESGETAQKQPRGQSATRPPRWARSGCGAAGSRPTARRAPPGAAPRSA